MSGTKKSRDLQLFLMIGILLSILIAAGCISPSSAPVPPPQNISLSATTMPPVTTPPTIVQAPVHCPNGSNTSNLLNGELFIRINPVPHHYLGDIITFDGITNLPAGEMITFRIEEGVYHSCPKRMGPCSDDEVVRHCCEGLINTIAVLSGDCDLNTWSWDVNSSEHGFYSDGEYIIYASGRNGAVQNTSLFTVYGLPKLNITLNLPENDPNAYAIRFSGQVNTGNGPAENLLLTVSSDSGKKASYSVPIYQNGTRYFWNFTLKKSAITPYNFLLVNVSSATSPEIRIERTFLYNNEPAYYPYNPYGP